MKRLPIRVRLTVAFSLAMAVVLAALGVFVYLRVGSALLHSIDQALRGQAIEAAGHVSRGRPLLDRDTGEGASRAELLSADGRVLASDPPGQPPLLSRIPRHTALETTSLRGARGAWRVLVTRRADGSVLVVAHSLEGRAETLDHLLSELVVAGIAGIVLAAFGGYLLAAGALRPVESMRLRAGAVSASTPGARLPVPPARDEVARLAETLNEMLARLETAFAHERRFVADASHELRTPLALLKTELELALARERTKPELERALRSAAEETDRLVRLAEDLLLIARADQGRLPVRPEPVDVRELVADEAARFDPRAAAHGRAIVVGEVADAVVEADPLRLHQALGNLLENALVHGRGTITVGATAHDGVVELHVVDEGAGFPAAFLPRAFERFSVADEARSAGGSGLGLAIVELVAHAHGGSAGASTREDGAGADVWIRLPRAQLAAQPPRARIG